jgi:signal transduction histidine kinase
LPHFNDRQKQLFDVIFINRRKTGILELPIFSQGNSVALSGSSTRRSVPLHLLLVVPFVLQISAAVGIVGYLSFRNGQNAVNQFASQLRQRAGDRLQQNLKDYLQTPHVLNQTNAIALRQELKAGEDLTAIEPVLMQQLQIFNLLHYTCWANQQGQYTGVAKLANGTLNIEAVDDAADPKYRTYSVTDAGSRKELLQSDGDYDARTRPWYKQAIAARKATWSEPYIWFNQSDMSIDALLPLFNAQNQPVGVLASPLKLSRIKDYLQRLRVSDNAQSFIVEESGLLIASTADSRPFRKGEKSERISASQSKNPLIRATAEFLKSQPVVQKSTQLDFDLNQQRQLVQVIPFADGRGVDWQIVVVVPEADLMGRVHRNTQITALLCLLALLGAIASSIWTARRIARPILKFSEASTALAIAAQSGSTDQLDQSVFESSQVRELQALAIAFNQMAAQIQHSFTQLEQTNHELADRTQTLEQTLVDLKQSQVQLIQSEKLSSLGQLVAGIAHEINNPVSFIYGNLQPANQYIQDLLELLALYQQEYPANEAITKKSKQMDLEYVVQDLPKLWASLKVGADRIRDIVLSLRNFSRTDEAELKAVNLHDGIDSTLMILRNRWKAQDFRPQIEIVKDYGELPLVECYAGQLNQVLMNILVNAIDALDERDLNRKFSECEEQPSTLWIGTSVENEWARVTIADNGTGMSETTKERLFEPFYTTKPIGKGTGLGMSISHQIITERHRGRLACESTLGEGTKFVIEIPVSQSR